MIGAGRRSAWWRWLAIAALLAVLATGVRFESGLAGLLPADGPLAATARFFDGQRAGQLLVLEGAGPAAARDRHLHAVAENLAPLGVTPLLRADAGAAARLLDATHQHLDLLVDPARLAALPSGTAALAERLRAVADQLRRPDGAIAAPAIYREVLGLGPAWLHEGLRTLPGVTLAGGIAQHGDGVHAALVLQVPFVPGDGPRTAALLERCAAGAATAAEDSVRLEAVGSYRSFHDNVVAARGSLLSSLPMGLALVAVLLLSLFRSWRACLVSQVPALFAVLAAAAALRVGAGGPVPVLLLGFISVIVGVAVDYGLHVVHAHAHQHLAAARRPLALSCLTTVIAFACLALSPVPALRDIGLALAAALTVTLLAALDLAPHLLRRGPRPANAGWPRLSARLAAWTARGTWRRPLATGLITVLALLGATRLRSEGDLTAYDGSTPATRAAIVAFEQRWGQPGGSNFLVARAADRDAALARLAALRRQHGLADSEIERFLPDAATQRDRRAAWNAHWREHGPQFTAELTAAAKAAGVRASAFDLARYAPVRDDAPLITAETWQETPVAVLLERLLLRSDDGHWQVAAPVADAHAGRTAALAAALNGSEDLWLASRRELGSGLMRLINDELLRLGMWALGGVAVVLFLTLRSPQAVAAALAPPLVALLWTFGALGWLGLALTPFHVLIACFVLGIGVDAALFLREPGALGRSLAPILATTATTLAGLGSLALSPHPVQRSCGLAVIIGMSACLLTALLLAPLLYPRAAETAASTP